MRRLKIYSILSVALFMTLCAVQVYAQHTSRYDRPIPMGVSIGNTPSLPYIYAGTAGMRVYQITKPSNKFILSNNHVLGAVGPSLCPGTAPFGTWTLQPGTLDIGDDPGKDPFYLAGISVKSVPIDFSLLASNMIDAAIAYTTEALAGTTILEVGEPNQALGIATAGMEVVKSGRNGVTNGTIEAVNLSVLVSYGGSACSIARFIKQFSIIPGAFSAAGDSGSVVLDATTNTPVGLLFAGSDTSSIANHIYYVYKALGVFVDGPGTAVSMDALSVQFQAMDEEPHMLNLKAIQARHEGKLFNIPGVFGIGIGLAENDVDQVFIVYIKTNLSRAVRNKIPREFEGVPVRVIETDEFKAY